MTGANDYNLAMFALLGRWMSERAWAFVVGWLLVVAAGVVWSVYTGPVPPGDVSSFLPPDAMHNRAMALMQEAFPRLAARTSVVVIAERLDGLTPGDLSWLDDVARQGGQVTEGKVLSPADLLLQHRLVSADGQAAMALINLSSNFMSSGSVQAVERIENLLGEGRPEGLTVEITGSGGIGRDYTYASQQALDNTTWVTIAAVLIILIVVYRSPVGALVPLVSIGASVYLAFVLMSVLATHFGWVISNMERIFAVVLLFGAGVDYALFWIARYRESLGEGADLHGATEAATRQASPAILASAGTTILGLTGLLWADLVPAQLAGRVLPVVLCLSLLAALTLSPALARVLGTALFWPVGIAGGLSFGQRRVWPALASGVTRYPRTVLSVGLIGLLVPATLALRLEPRFDSLEQLPEGSSSWRGYAIAHAHFPPGELFPNTLLLKFDAPLGTMEEARDVSERLAARLREIPKVRDVYSLDRPLGRRLAPELPMLSTLARGVYLSAEPPVLRFEILIDPRPFTLEAMSIMEQVAVVADQTAETLAAQGPQAELFLHGLTPYIIGVRDISDSDQIRVMVIATLIIGAIVYWLIRDWALTLFMVFATWLTFGATLTITSIFFVEVMGLEGLDYKVRLIVFVIVVAVGQDYNIFLVSRLMEESSETDDAEATRRAIVRTGAVISSCGVIMAATLGSLWAGGLTLLQQAGFALALGILIDTFFVRPLLIPSFVLVAKRRQWVRQAGGRIGTAIRGSEPSTWTAGDSRVR